jgi:hypothetical protein
MTKNELIGINCCLGYRNHLAKEACENMESKLDRATKIWHVI